jgi:hypothetical protein
MSLIPGEGALASLASVVAILRAELWRAPLHLRLLLNRF